MNALPALQTVFYDGWVLRFADGHTRRSNSINPIYSSYLDLDEKIEKCERIYRAKGLQVVFKLTDAAIPENLESRLVERGYLPGVSSPVSIQLLDLEDVGQSPALDVVRTEVWSEQWQAEFMRLNKVNERHYATLKNMLSSIVPRCCYFSMMRSGSMVASGLAVLEDEYVGLFDIVADSNLRRQGLGKAITVDMLSWGKENGARRSYLQVVHDNEPAVALYAGMGFREVYRYWYLVKE